MNTKLKQLVQMVLQNKELINFFEELKFRFRPVLAYWSRLNDRERQLLAALGIALGIALLLYVIGIGNGISDSLVAKSRQIEQYRLDSSAMASQYKSLIGLSASEFSDVSGDRIRGDVTHLLEVSDPDVSLQDGLLVINANNIRFDAAMFFLDQVRKSYGLFPSKLKITRLLQAGTINFSATFKVEQQ